MYINLKENKVQIVIKSQLHYDTSEFRGLEVVFGDLENYL